MPGNPDGSWTSPTTGKTYPADMPIKQYDPEDYEQVMRDLSPGRGEALGDIGGALGVAFGGGEGGKARTQPVGGKVAGGALDTSLADQDRLRMGTLLADLQQQAITGGGAWEKSLKDATDKASSSAMAIGQSQPGTDYASALRNIGNAQGAVGQRAVGQGNMLREQSKLDAQGQISGLLNAQGGQDIQQATSASDARYGPGALNAAKKQQEDEASAAQGERDARTYESVIGGITSFMSDGGTVPGEPKVFGNDSRNDVAPAMLTPGEIVIPLSHSGSPESAADFVRALQRNQPQRFAGGGGVGQPGDSDPTGAGWDLFTGTKAARDRRAAEVEAGMAPPTASTGGLLDPTQFNQNRAAAMQNQQALGARAAGTGPSIAPQQMQNATDDAIGAAMQAGRRGPSAGDVVQGAAGAIQGAAGQSAATAQDEQAAGQIGLGQSLVAQRGRDQAMSLAQQQAAWRDTLLKSGIALDQQALVGQIADAGSARTQRQLAGAAQGLAAYSSASSGNRDGRETSDDYAKGGPTDLHDPNDLWAGGEVTDTRGADFVRALRRSGR